MQQIVIISNLIAVNHNLALTNEHKKYAGSQGDVKL